MISNKGILLLSVVFLLLITKGFSRRGGFLHFQFLCYKNPGHLDQRGETCDSIPSKNCDPFFLICISNKPIPDESLKSCPVYHKETEPYSNEEAVCNTPYDNRGALKQSQIIELPYPLQEIYYVRIVVKDANQFSAHQNIAVFTYTYSEKPSQNFNDFQDTVVFMNREERKIHNAKARLQIAIGSKCDRNLYGDLCVSFCRSSISDTYTCSKKGEKICKPGWEGFACDRKDVCHYFPCARGATCIKIANSPKCMCNGTVGPQCNSDYRPCDPNPCQNGGQCVYENTERGGFICYCQYPYHGDRCQMRFDLCQLDPCLNNGTCVLLSNGTRLCKCPPDFKGAVCDYMTDSTWNYTFNESSTTFGFSKPHSKLLQDMNYGILFGVLFGLCVLMMILIGIYVLVSVSRRKKTIPENRHNMMYMKDLPRPTVQPSSPCEYGTYSTETQYDTIEGPSTYVYHMNGSDGYLVPATKSPTAISDSSDYIPMFNNDNLYKTDPITVANTNDNEELPPLPSRNPVIKRKKLCGIFLS